ncbi:hypothetical protein GCM10010411_08200 [Actinomadura fulvescens]|uniref:Uncharacterized protein n=1 Tax=Actinomadura fulvescens TaxID=46160 RepID=A0ABN3PCP3_9ACTN
MKYIANNAAKNMSSDDNQTIVPTLTRLGRFARAWGVVSIADAVATGSIITSPDPTLTHDPPPGVPERVPAVPRQALPERPKSPSDKGFEAHRARSAGRISCARG